jgi:hypothetical protein
MISNVNTAIQRKTEPYIISDTWVNGTYLFRVCSLLFQIKQKNKLSFQIILLQISYNFRWNKKKYVMKFYNLSYYSPITTFYNYVFLELEMCLVLDLVFKEF